MQILLNLLELAKNCVMSIFDACTSVSDMYLFLGPCNVYSLTLQLTYGVKYVGRRIFTSKIQKEQE